MSEQNYCAADSCCPSLYDDVAAPVREEITVKLLPNTAKNRGQLTSGYGYLVKFYDIDTECEKIAAAVWDGEKFKYFDGRLIYGGEPRLIPPAEKIPVYNRVTAFCRFVDWEA